MSQSFNEIMDATHCDVVMRNKRTGQQWKLLDRVPKAQAVSAADAVFDALTIADQVVGSSAPMPGLILELFVVYLPRDNAATESAYARAIVPPVETTVDRKIVQPWLRPTEPDWAGTPKKMLDKLRQENPNKNPNCEGTHCTHPEGEVRLLPTGGGGNSILCFDCFYQERTHRISNGTDPFDVPRWEYLRVYEGGK